jgi:hypothetical protein
MMLNYKAVFISPVRDCANYIEHTIKTISSVAKIFEEYLIIFLESDSSDSSLVILEEFSKKDSRIKYFSLGDLKENIPSRTCRIHTVRNFGLDICIKNKIFENFDFYIPFDADEVNQDLTQEALLSCFKYSVDTWDGMFANQNFYYDVWTVRCKNWIEDDCWYQVLTRPSYMSYEDAANIFVRSKQIQIPANYGLIEVDSAFGGIAIYNTKIIKDAKYFGIHPSGKYEQSDHIEFNKYLKLNGAKFFINSEMINYKNKEA